MYDDDLLKLMVGIETHDRHIDTVESLHQQLSEYPRDPQLKRLACHQLHQHQGYQYGLESYHGNLGQEEIVVSLEGIRERLIESRMKLQHKLTNGLLSDMRVKQREAAIKTLRDRATLYKESLKNMKRRTVEVKSVSSTFSINGRLAATLSAQVENDQRGITEIFERYVPRMIRYAKTVQSSFTTVIASPKAEVLREIDTLSKVSHPVSQLSASLRDGTRLMGDRYVNVVLKPGEGDVERLRAYAKMKPPRIASLKKVKAATMDEVTIDRNEALRLINALTKYADLMEAANTALPKVLSELQYDKGYFSRNARGNKTVKHPGIDAIRKLTQQSVLQVTYIAPDTYNHIRRNSKAIITLLERLTKANDA